MTDRVCLRVGCGVPLTPRQRTYCSLRCSAMKGRKPRSGHTPQWPPARVMHLMALWADGVTASNIGLRLGTTANSIVGKAHRLKLTPRPSPIRPKSDKPPKPRQVTAGGAKRSNGYAITGHTLAPLSTLARKAPPSMPRRHTPSIVPVRPPPPQRTPEPSGPKPSPFKTCQWPISDDRPHRFCGAPVDPQHGVYCRIHASAARGSVPRPLDGLADIAA